MADEGKVGHVVVDSGGFIRNAPLRDIGISIYSIAEVVQEIRDKPTRQRLQVLPYEIKFREPSSDSIKIVTDFSKKTGDYRSLSAVDIRLMALTYQLEKEHVGTGHIKTEPEKKIIWNSTKKQLEKPTDIAGFYLGKEKPSGSRTTSISQGSGVDADDLVSHVDNVTDAKEQDESSNVNKVVRGEEDSDSEADGHSTNAGAIEPSDSRSSGQPSVDSSCRDSQEFMAVASSVVGVGGIDNGTHEEGEGEDKGNHEEGEGEDTGSHEEGEGEDKGSQEGEGEDKGSHEEGEGEDKGSHEEGEGEDKENHEKIEENQRVIKQGLQEGTSIPADCMIDDDSEEDTDDDEDEDGWITPSNIREVCRAMGDLNMDKATVAVGCLTTDFAMQNVLIQMGLNVISVDGLLIKQAKSYALRCYACMKITTRMDHQFCPHCGNKTLSKVSMSVTDDGTVQYFMSRRKPNSTRGLKYSLPLPRGGKHSNDPILCADQPGAQQRTSKAAKIKYNALDLDYLANTSPFAPIDVTSRSALLGIRSQRQNFKKRRNPNENKKVYGRRK